MCENGVARCPIEEEDPEYMEVVNGTLRPGLRTILCDTCVDQIRSGYRCVNCNLRNETGYPEACAWCEFPMRDAQSETFARVYAGWRDTRGQIDWDAEMERLERQRRERELAERASRSNIVVPRGLS